MKKIFLLVAISAIVLMNRTIAQSSVGMPLQDVVNAYLDVKNMLTKDNGDSVRTTAKILFETIEKAETQKLSTSEQKTWTLYKEKLSFEAAYLKGTSELEIQREHFMKLSDYFYKVLKALNINSSDLYYQYCPMANDGKGAYWISEQEGILNPYFGKKMLKCGSTKETLTANH